MIINNQTDEQKLMVLDEEIAQLRERRRGLEEERARLETEIEQYYQILMTEFTKQWQPLRRVNWTTNNEF